MSEPKSIHASEDWGVVLQSVPSRNKKVVIKRLEEIFSLEKRDAEQILANMPLILVDNLSFGLAARIKKFFQTLGAVTETTNHDMIKKNCFQISWPQTPDLSFFMKGETVHAEMPAPEKKEKKESSEASSFWKKALGNGKKPETPQTQEASLSEKSTQETPLNAPSESLPLPKVEAASSASDQHIQPAPEQSVEKFSAHAGPSQAIPEVKPQSVPSMSVDADWERRARELNEKLRKIQEEKQQLHEKHTEAAEKVKSDFQQQLEKEKQKKDEIAKAYEDLKVQAEHHEALTKEGDEWRSKAESLGEKIRELETNLTEKSSAIEQLAQQKNDLFTEQSQKAADLAARVADLEKAISVKDGERSAIQGHASELEKTIAALQHELENSKNREAEKAAALEHLTRQKNDLHAEQSQKAAELAARAADLEKNITALQQELENSRNHVKDWSQKAGNFEREVQQMSESLRSRDAALAQFEQQIMELAEKSQRYETLRLEHEQLLQERATIRQEYEVKLGEQEIRLARIEEEHRRHKSRADRKNAAATRELGEWIRGIDTIRQGLQKLILFLGSEAAVLDTDKKTSLKSPLTRGPDAPTHENS